MMGGASASTAQRARCEAEGVCNAESFKKSVPASSIDTSAPWVKKSSAGQLLNRSYDKGTDACVERS